MEYNSVVAASAASIPFNPQVFHSLIYSSFDATTFELYIRSSSDSIQITLSDMISPELTEWVVSNGKYNNFNDTLSISGYSKLKQIVIGNDCFGKVRLFELDGLNELESVVIGQRSFRIGDSERSDGTCRIVNCPKLKSIQISYESFSEYHSFELNNLPSLESIDIGESCFHYAPSFLLTGLFD